MTAFISNYSYSFNRFHKDRKGWFEFSCTGAVVLLFLLLFFTGESAYAENRKTESLNRTDLPDLIKDYAKEKKISPMKKKWKEFFVSEKPV